ncbi:MAG: hypothetical protein SWK76_13255 [Actinomycetota bacterium]|nr:hypothetical protein [Actinomycetota bacterium]
MLLLLPRERIPVDLIGALIGNLDASLETERHMRVATGDQVGHTDDNLPPDDAYTYLQPYHMDRAGHMEYDLYSNQGDKDDNIFMTYMRAIMTAMLQDGLAMACGTIPLIKWMPVPLPEGMQNVDDLLPFIQPNMAVDSNNIAARRWDYKTGLSKKLSL